MAEEAKIKITIDPKQARKELDRIERAAPGRSTPALGGAQAGAARQAGGTPKVTGGGAFVAGGLAGRRFATAVKTAVRGILADQAVSKGFPALSELITEGVKEIFAGSAPLDRDIADNVSKLITDGLDDIEEALRQAKSSIVSIASAGSETASAVYGAAITGNRLSAGQAGDIFSALRRANEIQFENRSRGKAQELRIFSRNQGDQMKDFMAGFMENLFPLK